MQKKILGLDICENSLSAALLKTGLRQKQIIFSRHLQFSEPLADGFRPAVKTLEVLMKSMPVLPDVTAVSLPSGWVSFRNVISPFKNRHKIQQILPFELEPTMPSPVENLVFDFSLAEHEQKNHVIAASLDREIFGTFLEDLSSMGLDPSRVSPSGEATVNCLARSVQLPRQSLAVHLDFRTVTLYEMLFQKPVLIRSFRVPASGGSRFESIARGIEQTLLASGDIICRDFFPGHIWLTGSDKELEMLAGFLKDRLNVPGSIPDIPSLVGLRFPEDHKAAERFNNALGLAYSESEGFGGFNFRKGRFSPKSQWSGHRTAMIRTASLAVMALFMFFGLQFFENRLLQKKLDTVNQEITRIFASTFPEVTRIVDPVHQMKTGISEITKERQIPDHDQRKVRAIDILNEISRKITYDADVELTQLVLGSENLQLSGTASSFNTVNQIQNQLEPVPFFRKVMISSATVERSGEKIQFNINIDL